MSKTIIEDPKEAWTFLTNEELAQKRMFRNFSRLSQVHSMHNELVTGKPDHHFLEYFFSKYFPGRKPKIASMGCGEGHLERWFGTNGYPFSQIDGYEFNPDLISYAQTKAREAGLNNIFYHTFDLNLDALPKNSYDVIIFFHSLHHVENLEACLERVQNALVDGGKLFLVEYVGLNRQQRSPKVMQEVQKLLDTVPDELKVDLLLSEPGQIVLKNKVRWQTPQEVIDLDPSECVRSEEIMDVACKQFHLIEEAPLAGAVSEVVFQDIAGNFDDTNSNHIEIINHVLLTEKNLLLNKQVDRNYVFAVFEKR